MILKPRLKSGTYIKIESCPKSQTKIKKLNENGFQNLKPNSKVKQFPCPILKSKLENWRQILKPKSNYIVYFSAEIHVSKHLEVQSVFAMIIWKQFLMLIFIPIFSNNPLSSKGRVINFFNDIFCSVWHWTT